MSELLRQANFWTTRLRPSGPFTSLSPEELRKQAIAYFNWCNANPLKEEKVFSTKDGIERVTIGRMRAFTIKGLCGHLGITDRTFENWKKRPEGDEVGDMARAISDIIYTQKFEGAAAEMLNPAFIARDIGLADKVDHTSSDGSMTPRETQEAVLDALRRKHGAEPAADAAGDR
jgi:hypothetical protein